MAKVLLIVTDLSIVNFPDLYFLLKKAAFLFWESGLYLSE